MMMNIKEFLKAYFFVAVLLVGVTSVSLYSCSSDDPEPMAVDDGADKGGGLPDDDTASGEVAPAFSLKDTDGNEVHLSDFEGKVVVLFVFGYNCPSCKAVAPKIQTQLVDAYSDRSDFMVLGLDQWNGNLAAVKAFKNSAGISFPLLLNASSTAQSYGISYDKLVVIDKEGHIDYRGMQVASKDIDSVKELVDGYFEN